MLKLKTMTAQMVAQTMFRNNQSITELEQKGYPREVVNLVEEELVKYMEELVKYSSRGFVEFELETQKGAAVGALENAGINVIVDSVDLTQAERKDLVKQHFDNLAKSIVVLNADKVKSAAYVETEHMAKLVAKKYDIEFDPRWIVDTRDQTRRGAFLIYYADMNKHNKFTISVHDADELDTREKVKVLMEKIQTKLRERRRR